MAGTRTAANEPVHAAKPWVGQHMTNGVICAVLFGCVKSWDVIQCLRRWEGGCLPVAKEGERVSQIENHWDAVLKIETELMRKMIALGFDWHDETKMSQLAAECKTFGPAQANAAYASNDRVQVTKAELFALASLMMRTMEEAANEGRDVHGGEVWKALGKHLYR
jgi:hypothetical protein